jgi:hypothetical protein
LSLNKTYDIGNNRKYILIEAALKELVNEHNNNSKCYYLIIMNMLPIIAYSSDISDNYGNYDYCGLRNVAVQLSLWTEEYKIMNYIWFEIRFLKQASAVKK